MSSSGQNDADEFRAAFEDGPGGYRRELIEQVRDNDQSLTHLELSSFVQLLNPLQWRLIGRYVARNTHLRVIGLGELTDQYMPHLFSELPKCPHLVDLRVRPQQLYFGREGIESMIPFLRNSCKLAKLSIVNNARVDDECFRLIVGALNGGGIERLVMAACGLTDITALRNCTLPNLKVLDLGTNRISAGLSALEHLDTLEGLRLSNNDIGLEQCIELSGLLRNPNTSLRKLGLRSSKLCDESIEALAGALKHNSTLKELDLEGSSIRVGERGYLALLRLLNDVSSIDRTYNSNHTLVTVKLPYSASNPEATRMKKLFGWALDVNNRCEGKPRNKAGQMKVLQSQLSSIGRKNICLVQGVEFASTGSILADIDSCLLPNVLALVGRSPKYGRDELFNALVETAPDLMALIDRKALMENLLSRKMAQIAALTAEADSLSSRLRLLEVGVEGQPSTKGGADGDLSTSEGDHKPGVKKMRRC
ncbi:hypothetical protein ACHAXT_006491 [Thalassiosira profunda]